MISLGPTAIEAAASISEIVDPTERRSARLKMREEVLRYRLSARQAQSFAKLADALAKFGGGSLLTATLLLIIGGQAGVAAIVTAGSALFLFLVATIFWVHQERRASRFEFQADRLDAALKETERSL